MLSHPGLLALTAIFLLSTSLLTMLSSALRRLHRKGSKRYSDALGKLFFYHPFHRHLFPKQKAEGLFFAVACAQGIIRLCYAASGVVLLSNTVLFPLTAPFSWVGATAGVLTFLFVSLGVGEFLPRLWGTRYPEGATKIAAPIASVLLFVAFPISYLFMALSYKLSVTSHLRATSEPIEHVKEQILEMIQDTDATSALEPQEKKLIESVVTFRDRIAREVMVPRVEVLSLPADTPIHEAAETLQKGGYSRVPIYGQNVDDIIGVLMYKDVLTQYIKFKRTGDVRLVEADIGSIAKGVLYAPETKKITHLLQEFRNKQVHLAIIVDEWGGTEGIVTIEDILEEIVGEIADEYDEEEALFQRHPGGGWIIDARMPILDVEEQLGVKIPQDGDYDSVGGYIFHRASTIPSKGLIIEHDNFEMEILSSNERCVEKVRLTPSVTAEQAQEGE